MDWCPKHGYFDGKCIGCLEVENERLRKALSRIKLYASERKFLLSLGTVYEITQDALEEE